MSQHWVSAIPAGIRLAVQITPNARQTEVVGVIDDALKLKLQAQPIEGRANEALIKFLGKALGLPRSDIVITHGLTSKRKLIEIRSHQFAVDDITRLLLPA